MVAPDGFGQHGLVDQMVRALHEVEQNVELLFQQCQFASLHLHAPALRPERDVAQRERQIPAAAAAPQHAAYTRQQFGRVERFGQVVVGALFQPQNLVFERVACRYDNYVLALAQLLDMLQQPQSVAVGEHDIEQDAVVAVSRHLGVGFGVGRRRFDHVVLLYEGTVHDLAQRRFVFHDQNLHATKLRSNFELKSKRRTLLQIKSYPSVQTARNLPAEPTAGSGDRPRRE